MALSVEDTAAVLGLSRNTVYSAIRSGEIPCVRVGRRFLVPTALLAEMLGLGMYGAATFKMRAALQLETLEWLPKVALAIALTAWAATAAGLVHLGVTTVTGRRGREAGLIETQRERDEAAE